MKTPIKPDFIPSNDRISAARQKLIYKLRKIDRAIESRVDIIISWIEEEQKTRHRSRN